MNGFWRFAYPETPVSSGTSIRAAVAVARSGAHHRRAFPANEHFVRFGRMVRPYGTALCLVAAALLATLILQRFFPYPFLFFFFAAVMASAWLGGTSGGLFAVCLSTVLVDYFFVPPFDSLAINATDSAYFFGFVVCALVASWISSSKRKNEVALREARDELETRVAERTAELRTSNLELRETMQEHQRAQEALLKTRAEVAHLSRVLTMGELTTSIAHEMSQPLTAVVTHGHACLEWLSSDPPNIAKAKQSAGSIVQDGTRAGAVLSRIRALFKKDLPARDWLDVNEVIKELAVLLRDEAIRRRITLRLELARDLPMVRGDRVQLQQVLLNLVMNGMDALTGVSGGPRELVIRAAGHGTEEISVSVEDCGVGFAPELADKIFEPFFTTKPQGIGMGMAISRSIIEAHGGRLWAEPRASGGSVFQFVIPLRGQKSDG